MSKITTKTEIRAWTNKEHVDVRVDPIYGQPVMHVFDLKTWKMIKSILDSLADLQNPIPKIIAVVKDYDENYME